MPAGIRYFFISLIIAIFSLQLLPLDTALSYPSPDIPIGHWSYESVEKLAISGLLGVSELGTKPMTRVQMAYKIKEAMDTIEEENLPPYLCFNREQVEYLQSILYRLIDEFRNELILIGVTTAQLETDDDRRPQDKYVAFNPLYPIEVEQRYVSSKSKNPVSLENENGLRLEDGYNVRTRAYSWMNAHLPTGRAGFSFSARPAFILTENDAELFLDEGSAKFSLYNVEISTAKGAMWWGPGFHGSMLMSNNAEPLNLTRFRTIKNFRLPWVLEKLGSFGINFFISKLEEDRTIKEPTLAGLRLEWSPLPRLSLGASRTSIMDGTGRPKPNFKDYIKIFFARSKDEFTVAEAKSTDTDQLASLDIRFVMPLASQVPIASGLELYGEWAGEDRFSFWENESPGLLAGLFLVDCFRDKGTDFRVEYAKNKSAWYNHGIYNAAGTGTAYTYKGGIIGHHMGGDSDDIFFRISKELPFLSTPYFNTVKAGAQLDIERHGLSGSLQEKKIEMAADVLWTNSDTVSFSIRYELENWKNLGFESGKTSRNHIILAEVNLKF